MSGEGSSSSSPPAAASLRSSPSTPLTSRSTARPEGPKKGDAIQAVGRSRVGRTSKIHALADDLGRPVAFTLTPGNLADISVAKDLLDTLQAGQKLTGTGLSLATKSAIKSERATEADFVPGGIITWSTVHVISIIVSEPRNA